HDALPIYVMVGKIDCQKCHGQVQEMEILKQHAKLTMGWCINCHRSTDVKMEGNKYYEEIHKQLKKKNGVETLTEAQIGGVEYGRYHYYYIKHIGVNIMSSKNKKYWSTIDELEGNDAINNVLRQNEFAEEIPTDEFLGDKKTLESSKTTRRDFLKYVGFTTAAASL